MFKVERGIHEPDDAMPSNVIFMPGDELNEVEYELPELFPSSSNSVEERMTKNDIKVDGGKSGESDNVADEIVDGGYGWVVVGAQLGINAVTWGVNASFGIYLAHYLEYETFPGTTPLVYAFVIGLSAALPLLMAPVSNYLVNKLDSHHIPMAIGLTLEALGLLCASWATEIWHLFLTQGVAFGLGMGLLYSTSIPIPSLWFHRRRGLALGLCTSGSGLGGFIFSLAAPAMINHLSLGWSFRITAIIQFSISAVCVWLTRVPPNLTRHKYKVLDINMTRNLPFWSVSLWGSLSLAAYFGTVFSASNYSISVLGLTSNEAGVITACVNLGNFIGRPVVGILSDKFGHLTWSCFSTAIGGLTCLVIWMNTQSYGVMIFFALINGAFIGTFWVMSTAVMADVVGLRELPSAMSLLWVTIVPWALCSETIALEIRSIGDKLHYRYVIAYLGCIYFLASFSLLYARAHLVGIRRKLQIQKDGREKPTAWWHPSKV